MSIATVILLYLGGLALIATEAFMPGLVIGLSGLAAVVVSMVHGFRWSVWLGLGQLGVTLVFVPAVIYLGIRQLMLKRTLDVREGVITFGLSQDMVGKTGTAVTPLRPAGTVEIAGKKYDVVAEGNFVDPGAGVRVIQVEGNRIVVKVI